MTRVMRRRSGRWRGEWGFGIQLHRDRRDQHGAWPPTDNLHQPHRIQLGIRPEANHHHATLAVDAFHVDRICENTYAAIFGQVED